MKIMFYSFGHAAPLKTGYNLSHIDLSYLHLIARKELRRVANHALSHVVFEEEVERLDVLRVLGSVLMAHTLRTKGYSPVAILILVRTLPIPRLFLPSLPTNITLTSRP